LILYSLLCRPLTSTLFPYTTLFRSTQFAVVKTPNRLHDYFLLEEQCFTETHPVTYLPSVSFRNLFPYYIFPKRTETSMVNLAFRSEEHTSELQSRENLVCRLLLEKK